jgi:hypothetical protein
MSSVDSASYHLTLLKQGYKSLERAGDMDCKRRSALCLWIVPVAASSGFLILNHVILI